MATVRLAVDGGLFIIAAVSLLIRQPLAFRCAREAFCGNYNVRITAVCRTAAFAVMTAADAAAQYVEAIPLWVDIAATIAAFVGAVWFTRWYPGVVRRRVGLAGNTGSAS